MPATGIRGALLVFSIFTYILNDLAVLVCIHSKEDTIMPKEYTPSFLIVHKMQGLNVLKGTAGKLSAAFSRIDPLRGETFIFGGGDQNRLAADICDHQIAEHSEWHLQAPQEMKQAFRQFPQQAVRNFASCWMVVLIGLSSKSFCNNTHRQTAKQLLRPANFL